jgi:phosphatidylglycerol:prolipoprotein diacylglycerol transferase
MRQVLYRLPIHTSWTPEGIPIYGYGLMLFVAFVACIGLAGRLARRQGIAKEPIQDLALWLFVGGIIGSRVVFMVQYGLPLSHFFFIWEGGLVFYGGLLGGAVAYALAYRFILRKQGISTWKLADVIAPCAALGLCLGRVGCLLNGCCYGHVACPDCPGVPFPFSGIPRQALVERGYQTAAGFTLLGGGEKDPAVVYHVEPYSPAADSGLEPGDIIVKVDGRDVGSEHDLDLALSPANWPRGKNDLTLTVKRDNKPVDLPAFSPRTLPLYPTQVFESISTGLLLLLLLAYFPLRRHDGELFALFLMLYPLHRFLNEFLRDDTEPVAFGMTLSQNGSLLVFAVGLVLWLWLRRMPAQYTSAKEPQLVAQGARA